MTISHDDGFSIHGIAAWIDFNGDHDFDDPEEKVGETLWPGDENPATPNSVTYSVTIPANAVTGTTRMRIRIYEDDDYTMSGDDMPVPPCQVNGEDLDWGETEDYQVSIADGATASLVEGLVTTQYTFQYNQFKLLMENEVQMAVISMNGQVLVSTTEKEIDFSTFSNGIYIVHVQTDKGAFYQVRVFK